MAAHHRRKLIELAVLKTGSPDAYVALTDTEGRAEVDPEEWLASAEQLVEARPSAWASQGRFASAKWYHVYFVVPDDERHPLYKRVT